MIAVILSGGAGTRLWPVSRELYPKPFMKLPDGQSLIQKAFLRATSLGVKKVVTVTGKEHYYSTLKAYQALGIDGIEMDFLIEPFGRNTAPAITLAALFLAETAPNEPMLILSADQLIQDQDSLSVAVKKASILAEKDFLVTIGIEPTYPATGFGYVEMGDEIENLGYRVKRFVEKPVLEVAQNYVEQKTHKWNAGIFCFTSSRFLADMAKYSPEILSSVSKAWQNSHRAQPLYIDSEGFAGVPSQSVDYALLERAERVAVVPADLGWSDLGSWDATAQLIPPDLGGNRIFGEAILLETQNTFVQTEGRVVAVIGVKDLVIVDTADALLISHRDKVQDVKKVVAQLQERSHDSARKHLKIERPWGSYTSLEESGTFRIRRVEVEVGKSLSSHLHFRRSEHWTFISGVARVETGNETKVVEANGSVSAMPQVPHRISNIGNEPLIFIEVQTGEYLGEDDYSMVEY